MSEINPFSANAPVSPNPVEAPKLGNIKEDVSPFQKFLGPTATKEQVARFMNQWINDIIAEMKKGDRKWKESMEKMRRGEY